MTHHPFNASALAVFVLTAWLCACSPSKPTVIITSPPSNSEFQEGEDITVQITASDLGGVTRVELLVDGTVASFMQSSTVQGQSTLTPALKWPAAVGTHTLLVRAYNAASAVSDPAAISVIVLPKVIPTPTSLPTPSTTPVAATPTSVTPAGCTDSSAFVADITVPDGTILAPGQSFNKIWRVRNNGTCAWGPGYQFVFLSGEVMSTRAALAVPAAEPGATADLLVLMTAPAAPGAHIGYWRLKNASGVFFGTQVNVTINVPAPPAPPPTSTPKPPSCSGTPNIESFTAANTTISSGSSTTLNWGSVTNADSAEIDPDIGGIATPGSANVSPSTTTTYTLIARCGSTRATRQVTITVQ